MNVLMLDEKRVVVEANEVPIQKMFESLGKCVAIIVVAVSFISVTILYNIVSYVNVCQLLDLSRVRRHFHKTSNKQTGRLTKIFEMNFELANKFLSVAETLKMSFKHSKRLLNDFVMDRGTHGPKSGL